MKVLGYIFGLLAVLVAVLPIMLVAFALRVMTRPGGRNGPG